MATAVVWLAVMVRPEVCPWKRRELDESKPSARKVRLVPAGMLLMTPPQEPLDLASSTMREDISEAEMVSLTRVTSLAERAWMEAANSTEPVSGTGSVGGTASVGWEVQARQSSSTAARHGTR